MSNETRIMILTRACNRGKFLAAFAIILGAIVAPLSRAQTPEQLFDRANQLYQQTKFSEARDAYESILHSGLVSGELYYNLANTYYKLGNLGMAILNYERAHRLMPNDDDVNHNLQLANLLITDRIEPTPRLFIWDYWDGIKAAFSLNAITWIGYILFVVLCASLSLVVAARTYRLRRFGLLGAGASILVLVLCVTLWVGKLGEMTRSNAAIVTAKITTVKNSPDPKSSDAFVLHSGVKVLITDSVNEWVKIRLADGKVGWMEEGAAEVI
jgi:hypothetical protein